VVNTAQQTASTKHSNEIKDMEQVKSHKGGRKSNSDGKKTKWVEVARLEEYKKKLRNEDKYNVRTMCADIIAFIQEHVLPLYITLYASTLVYAYVFPFLQTRVKAIMLQYYYTFAFLS